MKTSTQYYSTKQYTATTTSAFLIFQNFMDWIYFSLISFDVQLCNSTASSHAYCYLIPTTTNYYYKT